MVQIMIIAHKVLIVLIAITVFAGQSVGGFKIFLPRIPVISSHAAVPVKTHSLRPFGICGGRNQILFSSLKDVDNVQEKEKSKSGPVAYIQKYGPQYFIVWFSIYLPFLLTFFYVIENDLLNTVKYGIDPPGALNSLCNQFEKLTHNYELLKNVRGSTHGANFAAAYLMADLVPTTVFAVGVLGWITRNDTKDDDNDDAIDSPPTES